MKSFGCIGQLILGKIYMLIYDKLA